MIPWSADGGQTTRTVAVQPFRRAVSRPLSHLLARHAFAGRNFGARLGNGAGFGVFIDFIKPAFPKWPGHPGNIGLTSDGGGWAVRMRNAGLINLLANSVKFMPPSGMMTVKVAAAGGFAVADTGIGMDAEGGAKAFGEFGQVQSVAGAGTTMTVAFPASCAGPQTEGRS